MTVMTCHRHGLGLNLGSGCVNESQCECVCRVSVIAYCTGSTGGDVTVTAKHIIPDNMHPAFDMY